MSFKEIQAALDSRLAVLAGLMPVAWEGVNYTPVLGREFLRPTVINADSELICMSDGAQNNPGIYRVDAFYPIGKGIGPILNKLDEIYNGFKQDQTLVNGSTSVLIRSVSILQRVITEDSWLMGSLNINFASYDNLAA